jgi:hypothetical protein
MTHILTTFELELAVKASEELIDDCTLSQVTETINEALFDVYTSEDDCDKVLAITELVIARMFKILAEG